jgi:hypothetical protein
MNGDLYSVSTMCYRLAPFEIAHKPAVGYFMSLEDAEAAAIKKLQEQYPVRDGWRGHHANGIRIIPKEES